MTYAHLKNIAVSYDQGKSYVLENFNLEIQEGELLSLLGPSGCGKSTSLRAIAGFVPIDKGQFYLEEKDMSKSPVHERDFGFVFQNYALFPHMTVFENVAFGLKIRKMNDGEIKKAVHEMLEIVDIEELADRYPSQLSGGQRQRVALARALVIRPKLLLLDEPLSNLDAKLRLQMRHEIRRIQKQLGITTIFVTHDQEECFAISDRVAVMNQGKIEQLDSPENIYHHPKTDYVAKFVGFENFFEKDGQTYCLRNDDIVLKKDGEYKGKIISKEFLGKAYRYRIQNQEHDLIVNAKENYSSEESIRYTIRKENIKNVEVSQK